MAFRLKLAVGHECRAYVVYRSGMDFFGGSVPGLAMPLGKVRQSPPTAAAGDLGSRNSSLS